MVDRHRSEAAGAPHHVMNRGVARRTAVEGQRDAGEFLSGVRWVVEEGLLEVHAYCLVGTHFHMLVRSPRGELSRAMMLAQNRYARGFNRGRRRDGPLWRGRFLSKVVRTDAYRHLLVRCIDHNPVEAGIVADPGLYELGSAWQYSRTRAGPPSLCRGEIEGAVQARLGKARYDPRGKLADLVAAAPERVREWIRRRARLADGAPAVGAGVIDPDVLLSRLGEAEVKEPDWWIRPGTRREPGWRALCCALLHEVCGCTLDDVARRVGVGASTAGRHLEEHSALVLTDEEYERRASEVLSRMVRPEDGGGP